LQTIVRLAFQSIPVHPVQDNNFLAKPEPIFEGMSKPSMVMFGSTCKTLVYRPSSKQSLKRLNQVAFTIASLNLSNLGLEFFDNGTILTGLTQLLEIILPIDRGLLMGSVRIHDGSQSEILCN